MPKRVQNKMAEVNLSSLSLEGLSDNELVYAGESVGIGLKYGETVYEFNGNKKIMTFVKEKQKMGKDNKDLELTKNLASEGSVPEITNENETGVYLLNEQ